MRVVYSSHVSIKLGTDKVPAKNVAICPSFVSVRLEDVQHSDKLWRQCVPPVFSQLFCKGRSLGKDVGVSRVVVPVVMQRRCEQFENLYAVEVPHVQLQDVFLPLRVYILNSTNRLP